VTVFWILVVLIGVVLWIVFGMQTLCPSCGLELADSPLDRLIDDNLDHCRRCGWRRRR
jgi:hypothetical protein